MYLNNEPISERLILLLYIDDMLIAIAGSDKIGDLKKKLKMEFEMKDLGSASRIMGIDIIKDRRAVSMFLSQKNYLEKVLNKFSMATSRSVATPLSNHLKLSME